MPNLYIVFILTLLMHFIATLAYAVRVVGLRTGRLTATAALFNLVMLVSRAAHAVQGPLLASKVDTDLKNGVSWESVCMDFRWILIASTLGTLLGAVFFPTFRRSFQRWVQHFDLERSVPRLILHSFSRTGIRVLKNQLKAPTRTAVRQLIALKDLPVRILLLNLVCVTLLTAGSLAALYAAYFQPDLRLTSSQLAPLVTGIATLGLFLFVDPYLSILTDDVLMEKASDSYFSRVTLFLVISRFTGTLTAQLLLIPAAKLISLIAMRL